LGRDPVAPINELLHANIKNKNVMITGAGGSIGSELCRQVIRLNPRILVLYELNEFSLYTIEKELLKLNREIEVIALLGSVTDQNRVEKVIEKFSIHTIYHAAAYKHVPMVEKNITQGVENNIFGTLNTAMAAIHHQVETFVLISTDKAVRPTNVMGATKRYAELVLQALSINKEINTSTRFTMVRFGNVLGSSGSVVPLFREQIANGGPVTVTDERIIRFFMTIPEAAELVVQAGALGQGGDVFVLDMGEPVKIIELAKRMIHLSGLSIRDEYNPEGDIEIEITGLRPGEKLYEELLIGENVTDTEHKKIMRAEEEVISWEKLNEFLEQIRLAIDTSSTTKLRQLLINFLPDFKPQASHKDLLE
jgi:FlaA1/EpsC-like NDP-sugar epimerase